MLNYIDNMYGNGGAAALKTDSSMFDFLGNKNFQGGLAALGLGKDLIGGYLTWKNMNKMQDLMGRELGIKEAMWGEQKKQIDQFNKDRDKINAGYIGTPSVNTSPVFKPTSGLASSDVPATEQQSSVFRKQPEKQAAVYNY